MNGDESALERLTIRLDDLGESGQRVPCHGSDRDDWISDDADALHRAAAKCRPCPVYTLCDETAAQIHATAGAWGGRVWDRNASRRQAS